MKDRYEGMPVGAGGTVVQKYKNGMCMGLDPQPSRAIWNLSPSGFECGTGRGAAQLALAILLDRTGDSGLAARAYQMFKLDVVAGFGDRWLLWAEDVDRWIAEWKAKRIAVAR